MKLVGMREDHVEDETVGWRRLIGCGWTLKGAAERRKRRRS